MRAAPSHHAERLSFHGLSEIVRPPILFVDLLRSQGERLRLDNVPVGQEVPRKREPCGIVMFTDKPGFGAIRASTLLFVQVHAIDFLRAALARHEPQAFFVPVQFAGCRDHHSAFFSWSHGPPFFFCGGLARMGLPVAFGPNRLIVIAPGFVPTDSGVFYSSNCNARCVTNQEMVLIRNLFYVTI